MSEGRQHWFLPETPDVVGLLRRQVAVTIEGLEALVAWAEGADGADEAVADAERRGDIAKRDLLVALREAFVTPLEPEDVFALSRGLDWILNYAGDLVREAEVLSATPDPGILEMSSLLVEGTRQIDTAIASLGADADASIAAADAAIAAARRLDTAYYHGMAALLEVKGMRPRVSSRELYRRCSRIGDLIIDVAERVVYAGVKES